MKKIVCFLLSLFLCLSAVSAFAAGKLSVTKENFHYVTSFWNYGYAYAKVENVGDKPIKVNAGVLEIYDANGEALTSADYVQAYATSSPASIHTLRCMMNWKMVRFLMITC